MPIKNVIIDPAVNSSADTKILIHNAISNHNGSRLLILNDVYLTEAYKQEWFQKANPVLLNTQRANSILLHSNIESNERFIALINAHLQIPSIRKAFPNSDILISCIQIIDQLSDKRKTTGVIEKLSELYNADDESLWASLQKINLPKSYKRARQFIEILEKSKTLDVFKKAVNALFDIHVRFLHLSSVKADQPIDLLGSHAKDNLFVLPASVVHSRSIYFHLLVEFCKQLPINLYLDSAITYSDFFSPHEVIKAATTVTLLPDKDPIKTSIWSYQADNFYSSLQNDDQSVFIQWLFAKHPDIDMLKTPAEQEALQWRFNLTVSKMNYLLRLGAYLTVIDNNDQKQLVFIRFNSKNRKLVSYEFNLNKLYERANAASLNGSLLNEDANPKTDSKDSNTQDIQEALKPLTEQLTKATYKLDEMKDSITGLENRIKQLETQKLDNGALTGSEPDGHAAEISQSYNQVLAEQRASSKKSQPSQSPLQRLLKNGSNKNQ
ncbi:hypothetical protein [Limosilactobacillus allomucosae]|uniref:hypothetical protein n=1 Tax=Limosilactobacillus allomucosae TaxID=3142938 RepID=UPI00326678BA